MADWTELPDTSVDPDAPVTSDLMYALRDNPIAIAEGAPGAPKLRASGAFDSVSGNTLIVPIFNVPGAAKASDTSPRYISNISFMTIGSGSLRFWAPGQTVSGSGSFVFDIRIGDTSVFSAGAGSSIDTVVNFTRNVIINIGVNFPLTSAGSIDAINGFRIGATTLTLPIVRWA